MAGLRLFFFRVSHISNGIQHTHKRCSTNRWGVRVPPGLVTRKEKRVWGWCCQFAQDLESFSTLSRFYQQAKDSGKPSWWFSRHPTTALRVTTAELSGGSLVSTTWSTQRPWTERGAWEEPPVPAHWGRAWVPVLPGQAPKLAHQPPLIFTVYLTSTAEKHLSHPGKKLLKTNVGCRPTCYIFTKIFTERIQIT